MRNRKYESMTLEEQEIIAHIDSYKSHSSLRRFIKLKSDSLSSEVNKYARFKYLELKRAEWRKYYEKNKKNKILDKPKQYKYLDIIDRCNDISTLRTYKTFTDITKYELKIIDNKIKKINKEKYKENLEKSYIQRDVEQQISYQKSKDKMMKDFLAKGGKVKVYDFWIIGE